MCDSQHIEQAIKDCQSGKNPEGNFALIHKHYRPRLIRFFAARDSHHDDHEDLTQDVLTRVYKSIAEFRGGDSINVFSAWVFQIARHIGRDEIRRRNTLKRKGQTVSQDAGGDDDENGELSLDLPDASSQSSEEQMLTEERKRLVREAIECLPDRMRECMKYRYYQERNKMEIAILMGISVEAVKSHLRQGKAKLIEKLKAGGVID